MHAPVSDQDAAQRLSCSISGSSEMCSRTRAFPWALTPMGPIDSWSESLLSSINFVLSSPVSTILMVGPDLITVYNDAYIPTLAERHPRALGMRGDVLWADAWDAVGHQIEAVLHSGVSFKFDNVLIPVERDGRMRDTYFSYCFTPIFDGGNGTVLGVMCMAQDVTASHQALLDLAESQRKLAATAGELQQLMAATTDAVVSIDRDWRFSYLNHAALKTYSQDRQLIGRKLWEEFPDALFPDSPYVRHYEDAMYRNIASSFEAFYPEPLNIWMQLSVFPAADGIVTFSRDITEAKRAATVRMQTEKLAAVGRLASSIAHEINNPLAAVTNLLYIARNEEDADTVRTLLASADDELRRVAAIANQTLAFHKQSARPREIFIGDLFTGALNTYRSRLRNSGIDVRQTHGADHRIVVYEGEIRQVLNNLLSNAIDAMARGGRLELRSRRGTDATNGAPGLFITVADTGMGIPPQMQQKIFDAFYTTKGIGGTGLGLWISRDIIARHNGRLRLRSSQHPHHRGTVFSVFLPFSNPASAATLPSTLPHVAQSPAGIAV